jgi:hypothetical protein
MNKETNINIELNAIRRINKVLETLDTPAKARVMGYVRDAVYAEIEKEAYNKRSEVVGYPVAQTTPFRN